MSTESIIKAFEGVNVRIVWDDETEEYYFAVNDIVQVLTESTDVKQYVKRMRSRDPELNSKWGTICTPLRMLAPDGKMRMTKAATLQGILRIVQSIPSRKALTDEWQRSFFSICWLKVRQPRFRSRKTRRASVRVPV